MPDPTTAAAVASFVTGASLGASLIVAIGAQNTFVLRQGIRREHVGVVVAICTLLDIVLMAAGVAGLGAAVTARPRLLDALAVGGALLLAAYGLSALRRALRPQVLQAATAGAAQAAPAVALQVLAISLLNPHVYLDTVVLVGAVGARQPAGTQLAFVAGAGLASAAWFAALGFGARALAPLFARPLAWRVLDSAVAAMMGLIAARLLLSVLRPQ